MRIKCLRHSTQHLFTVDDLAYILSGFVQAEDDEKAEGSNTNYFNHNYSQRHKLAGAQQHYTDKNVQRLTEPRGLSTDTDEHKPGDTDEGN